MNAEDDTAAMPGTVGLRMGAALTAGIPWTVAFLGGSGRDGAGGGVSASGRTAAAPGEPNGDVCIGARPRASSAAVVAGLLSASLSSASGSGLATTAAVTALGSDVVIGASSGAFRTKNRSRVAGSTAR